MSGHYISFSKINFRSFWIEAITILAMVAIFLLPAIWNGFPFLFDDSASYLFVSNQISIPAARSPFYSIFLRLVHWKLSPWLVAIIQSLMCAWIIREFLRSFFNIYAPIMLLALATILMLGTSLPWFSANIMPDIFTSLMFLALGLLILAWGNLSIVSRIALVVFIATAISVHQANLIVALWAIPALLLCFLLGWRSNSISIAGLLAASTGMALGAAALTSVHIYQDGRLSLSSSGSVFALARLLGDGTALKFLDNACPDSQYKICEQLDYLKAYYVAQGDNPDPLISLSNHFLWQGPLSKLGGFQHAEPEAKKIIYGTLATYPLEQLFLTARNGWRQLFLVRTSDVLTITAKNDTSDIISKVFGPDTRKTFEQSKQYHSDISFEWDEKYKYSWKLHNKQMGAEFSFDWVDRIHQLILVASLIGLAGFIARYWTYRSRALLVTVFLSILVIGNAMTLGALSGPFDRYQSRVVWLFPLLVGGFALECGNRRKSSYSQDEAEGGISRCD